MHRTHGGRQYALCLSRTKCLFIRSQPNLSNVARIGVYTGLWTCCLSVYELAKFQNLHLVFSLQPPCGDMIGVVPHPADDFNTKEISCR